MGIRDSFSKLKKKIKHELPGSRPKPDRTGADTDGEKVDRGDSLPRLESRVLADVQGGGRAHGGGQRIYSMGTPLQLGELAPAEGSRSGDQGGAESGVDGWEVGQRPPHLHLDAEIAIGSGPGQEGDDINGEEVEQTYHSSPTSAIPHSRETDSMWTWLFNSAAPAYCSLR